MQIRAQFRRRFLAFEGDQPLVLRCLPADAVIQRAVAVVRPEAKREEVDVKATTPTYGVTKQAVSDGVVLDLFGRRPILGIGLDGFADNVRIMVDLGGSWLPLRTDGSLGSPGTTGNEFIFPNRSGAVALPGVATTRFQVLRPASGTGTELKPQHVASAAWRVAAVNASLRLGDRPPFWVWPGELAFPQESPDFAESLRAYLPRAQVEQGFAIVPLTLHSDALARVEVDVVIDYLRSRPLFAPGVERLKLTYDFDLLPQGGVSLPVRLPARSTVVPGSPLARVVGAFAPSRVAAGVLATALVRDGESRRVSGRPPTRALAQPIRLTGPLLLTGIDLQVRPLDAAVTLEATLLADAGVTPSSAPLLPAPLIARLDNRASADFTWINLPLAGGHAIDPGSSGICWLALRCREGNVEWAVDPHDARTGLWSSDDGLFSWDPLTPPVAARYRLRHQPAEFTVPIRLMVRPPEPAGPVIVPLDFYQTLGRVDFALDLPEIADALTQALHVDDSDFETNQVRNAGLQEPTLAPGNEEQLSEWAIDPANPAPLTRAQETSGPEIRIDNLGADAVLVQTITVPAGTAFTLSFAGWVVRQPSPDECRLSLGWRNAQGARIGAVITLSINKNGFDCHAAEGVVPDAAVVAELRLAIPAKAIVTIKEIGFRPVRLISAPVTLLAESPGELTVSDARVVYDHGTS